MAHVLLVDGFTDDPAALGVPPYISPMVRAVAGAALSNGADVEYVTIDQLRDGAAVPDADVSVLLAGVSVPGRYLRAMPATEREVRWLSRSLNGTRVLGGPAAMDDASAARFDVVAMRDAAHCAHDLLSGGEGDDRWRTREQWEEWLLAGATVVTDHPDFPHPLIAEVETYRGCHRWSSGGCSYCVEPLKGRPLERRPEDVVAEVEALHRLGVRNVRLGAQTCIVSYMGSGGAVPRPDPDAMRDFMTSLSSIDLDVLHLDNANPAVIATYPDESREVLRIMAEHCTAGNTLALGMESADPAVVEANNLNATPDQVLDAIRAIDAVGSHRGANGMPTLLPGLNIIAGLDGETARTYELDLEFLQRVLDEGLMVRRVNIRQVMPIRREFSKRVDKRRFQRFKRRVRERFDRPMLERVIPVGTVLRDVLTETRDGNVTFGRQVGTYPILVGIPYHEPIGRVLDVRVVDHGYRSVTAIEFPLDVNSCPMDALTAIPGIGRRRAERIVASRPMASPDDVRGALDDPALADGLLDWFGMGKVEEPSGR